jgi:hypothetical protein
MQHRGTFLAALSRLFHRTQTYGTLQERPLGDTQHNAKLSPDTRGSMKTHSRRNDINTKREVILA